MAASQLWTPRIWNKAEILNNNFARVFSVKGTYTIATLVTSSNSLVILSLIFFITKAFQMVNYDISGKKAL